MALTAGIAPGQQAAPPTPTGGARAGPKLPDWSLLRGRHMQSPIDEAIRRTLNDLFFPQDAVSVDISQSSSLPFAHELRDMFSLYAEKQVALPPPLCMQNVLMRRSF
jgi:hypothetical protein